MAISTSLAVDTASSNHEPRWIFKNADWKGIRRTVAQLVKSLPETIRDGDIGEQADELVHIVQRAL